MSCHVKKNISLKREKGKNKNTEQEIYIKICKTKILVVTKVRKQINLPVKSIFGITIKRSIQVSKVTSTTDIKSIWFNTNQLNRE